MDPCENTMHSLSKKVFKIADSTYFFVSFSLNFDIFSMFPEAKPIFKEDYK